MSLSRAPSFMTALRVRLELKAYTLIGGGRVGNVIEHVKDMIIERVKLGKGSIASVHCKLMPLVPPTSIKGVLRSIAEKIAKRLFTGSSIPEKLAILHHQPTPFEEDARRRSNLLVINTVHSDMRDVATLGFEIQTLEELERNGVMDRIPLGVDKGLRIAIPKDESLKKAFQEYLRSLKAKPSERLAIMLQGLEAGADKLFEIWASTLCPICILFGSPFRGSALRFTALLPAGLRVELARRYHVAIERSRGIRAEGKLYSIECMEPGTILEGLAYLLLPPAPPEAEDSDSVLSSEYSKALDCAQKLFEALMKYLENLDILIGGATSRGYGLAKLSLEFINQELNRQRYYFRSN
ncbi:MAG: hypothetical protein GXO32_06360 [Crenarchaeota archaeon]|nr:hypothetical protein [Thermoproteota archaeon]